jgi:nicotinate phosphoribosyltransferase
MAHSYIQSYEDEYTAFKAYAEVYPDSCVLLVDTYNTLKQGIPNAIKVQKEVLDPLGKKLKGIRLDSGDLAYLTIQARKMLDEAGLEDCKITVSNSLDEYLIKELISQGAQIDTFGVGERLVTARSEAVFGGVFKLSAIEVNKKITPKIKISENVQKTTTPGFKQVYRFYDENCMAIADVMTLFEEEIDDSKPYLLFDPNYVWKKKVIETYNVKPLLIPIFEKGKLVYETPSLEEIRAYHKAEFNTLWPAVIRLENPHEYYVDLSEKLWALKQKLIKKYKR